MSRIEADQARARFTEARVARLATADVGGRPHLVPVTFAVVSAGASISREIDNHEVIVTAVDHKPKRRTSLRRLRNIAENPSVTMLVDHYDDDWSALWWVRADGDAEIVHAPEHPGYVDALVARYPQYERHRPATSLIVVHVRRWSGWAASE